MSSPQSFDNPENMLISHAPVDVLDGLKKCFEALSHPDDLQSLTQTIATRLLPDVFGIDRLQVFLVERKEDENLISESLFLQKLVPLPPYQLSLALIEQQVRMVQIASNECQNGVMTLEVDGQCYKLFLMGDLNLKAYMIVFADTFESRFPVVNGQALGREQVEIAFEILIQQAQLLGFTFGRVERVNRMLQHDDLTGLFNYRSLEQSIDGEIKRYARFKAPFSLLFIDLDNFKPINDQFGHLAGSDILKQVADVLRDATREVDSVYRYGGDEYVILLIESNGQHAMSAAERVRMRIEQYPFRIDEKRTVQLTASIGVATCPDHGDQKEILLRMADESMYRSKRSGKNKVLLVDADISNQQRTDGLKT